MNKTLLEIINEMQSAILIVGGFMSEWLPAGDARVERLEEHVRNWAALQEKICPACGSDNIGHRHADTPNIVGVETDWRQCEDCEHQWDHQ